MFSTTRIMAFVASAVFAAVAIFFSSVPASPSRPPRIVGRNNTVLFLAGGANGLSNIHVAASYGLQEHAPHVRLHYASVASRQKDIFRVSSMATRKFPAASPISWHELPGPDYLAAVYRHIGNISGMIFPPGLKGVKRLGAGMGFHLDPWERDEYVKLYQHVRDLVVQLDPAVIVLDMSLRPALDATRDLHRSFVMLSPNALVDTIAAGQPWGKSLWKYPAPASGLAYPLSWKWIPLNMYLHARFAAAYLLNNQEKSKRAYYRSKGIQNNDHFLTIRNVPWITMTIPEAGLPLVVPDEVRECGPIVLDVTGVEDEGQELHRWLKAAPTVLINLGSLMKYDETRAKIMADTIRLLLQSTGVQVIWKYAKLGDYSDEFLRPLQLFQDNGRFRLSYWLDVEPAALLRSGHIVLSVHHGGANCFHEALYGGIPQVILPLWYDLYNYAQLAEYLGVGIWPGKDTAPTWDAETLSRGIKEALDEPELGRNARRIANVSRKYGGRAAAAAIISSMAAQGHS